MSTLYVTVPRARIEGYEKTIQDLQHQNNALIASKLKLIASTAKEIDRLRQYIHSLTPQPTATATTYTKNLDIEEKEQTIVTPSDIETITFCEYCGSASNVNNNYFISISSVGAAPNESPQQQHHQNQGDPGYIDQSQLNEEEEKKAEILYEDSLSDDHDDDHDVIDDYLSDNEHSSISQQDTFITPGRPSIITRGNSLPHDANKESMGEHADIPLPDNFMDDSFV